jgi:hypothetical protein
MRTVEQVDLATAAGSSGAGPALLVINAGRTRWAATGRGRENLAKSGARALGTALNRLSQRGRSDHVYYDYYGPCEAEAAAKPGPKGASVSAPLADKRG